MTKSRGNVHPVAAGVTFQEEVVRSVWARRFLGGLRIVLGFMFLWPFLDKLFGLGYMTPAAKAWIDGGTPAQGFMTHAEGPFAGFFASISGPWADWLFMLGLLGIGVAVLAGAGLKIAALAGGLLLLLMYLAEFPLGTTGAYTNPIFDSHWVEGLGLAVLAATYAGDTWGVGKWWGRKVGNGILR
ncbi:MAG: DoxX family protein [Intrasporangium sp.]|uniref:DoxX family protein n=1 Tax=Intrasporangium sp. TaxID=1925024 RepID=UPI00264A3E29|nr:DoxX family protein [Intrasporangium sp.]MDN5794891.1 DoxX family protein [Intrasporangium sp.]